MNDEILNIIIELKKDGDNISTYSLVRKFKNLGKGVSIVKYLIKKKYIYRDTTELTDYCSFNTEKLNRLLKLKNLSK